MDLSSKIRVVFVMDLFSKTRVVFVMDLSSVAIVQKSHANLMQPKCIFTVLRKSNQGLTRVIFRGVFTFPLKVNESKSFIVEYN